MNNTPRKLDTELLGGLFDYSRGFGVTCPALIIAGTEL